MSGKILTRTAIAALAGLLLTACATTPVPEATDAIANAEQALDRAQQAQAYDFAAFEFTKAQRKLNQAKDLARSDEKDQRRNALRLAEQSAVDARLAESKARLGSTRETYQEIEETVESLRQETGVTNGNGEGTQ